MRPETLYGLFAPITAIKGVGPRIATNLQRLVGERVVGLLWHLPTGLMHRRYVENARHVKIGDTITITLEVLEHRAPKTKVRRSTPYRVKCQDSQNNFVDLVFFHAYPEHLLNLLPIGKKVLVSGKLDEFNQMLQILHPDYVGDPKNLDQWQGPEPIYPLTKGITQKYLSKIINEALKRCPKLPEWIDQQQLTKNNWPSWQDAVIEAHHPQTESHLLPTSSLHKRLAYDELLANQLALLLIRRMHRGKPGRAFKAPGKLAEKLLPELPFEFTNAQKHALVEIHTDLESPNHMVRLLQGDVGSGKTVVAMLAMLHVVESGSQTALLAPTEILAQQHAATLTPWAEIAGVKLGLLTSKGKDRKQTLEDLANGEIDVIVGTHALIQEQVQFKDLGFAVIDEQHRFGVEQRLSLTAKGDKVDVLVMTATPIPRTLMLAAYGDLVTSRLDEKPAGRPEIITKAMPLSRMDDVVQRVQNAAQQGRKIYWVCPLVEESEVLDFAAAEDRFKSLDLLMPGHVGLVHGRMKSAEKDQAMLDFLAGKTQVLVATTVIEVGVHVPDATIMVIEHAERFGLSQLHQLRGRIGRGKEESTCLLLYAPNLTKTAQTRLKIMRETTDGFVIAEEDLRLRGGGDILGLRQSGLPEFALASYEFHTDLLAKAHHDAETFLQTDPLLTSARGKALKNLLYLFQKDQTVDYLQ